MKLHRSRLSIVLAALLLVGPGIQARAAVDAMFDSGRDYDQELEAAESHCEVLLARIPFGVSMTIQNALTQMAVGFSTSRWMSPTYPQLRIAFNAPQGWSYEEVTHYLQRNYPEFATRFEVDVADQWITHNEIDRYNSNVVVTAASLSRNSKNAKPLTRQVVPLSRVFWIFSGNKMEILQLLNDPYNVGRNSFLFEEVFPAPRRYARGTFTKL